MKFTDLLLPTLKENPKDAEARSHIVMMRSGMIRKLASGFYSYLPLGFKVLKKVEAIVREEMNATGANELLLPAVHPAELWKKTGRYDVMSDIMMTITRGDREYVLGPTHEEIITELASAYIKSYKDMPKILYQIQTKFRDEARPRFGVIRSREFIMKDAYSFDTDMASLDASYDRMYEAYKKIFNRCGLDYVIVHADPGAMGGNFSHEFMVLVDFGEDSVALCKACGYAASNEVAECVAHKRTLDSKESAKACPASESFDTPNLRTIDELTKKLKMSADTFIKTVFYTTDDGVVAALVNGAHEICEAKLARLLKTTTLALADEKTITDVTSGPVGFSGPIGLKKPVKIIADYAVGAMVDAIVGANKNNQHIKHVCVGRDFTVDESGDIRMITADDACPQCGKPIELSTSLEIGHVFKLGTKYTKAFQGSYLDNNGKQQDIIMGCYGIGVNRIIASCIEQHFDEEKGMIWPLSLAPFAVSIVTTNQKSDPVKEAAEVMYKELTDKGIDVLYDNRDDRMGVKLNDAELIGAPVHIIIGDRGLKDNKIEIRFRTSGTTVNEPVETVVHAVSQYLEDK